MFGRRSRGEVGPAIALVIVGFAVGGTLAAAALAARRRRRAKGASMADIKELARRLIEEPWKGNTDVIDEVVAPGYVGHDASEPEPITGPEGYKAQVGKYLAGFPDARITADDIFAAGDKVAARWTGRGTHTGEIAGIPPTGKQVTVTGITVFAFEGDQVVEDWASWDTLGMLIQLGAIPEPARA